MMLPGWLRPHRVVVALLTVAAGALACSDTTKPKAFSTEKIGEPSFTASSNFVPTPVGRGSLGTFNVKCRADGNDAERESADDDDKKSNADGYCAQLKSRDNTDIVVSTIAIAPGGHSGWHKHPGPVVIVVKTGTVTFYHGNDRTCSPTLHPKGTAFIEEGGRVGMARNEGSVEATVVATFFVPAGGPTFLDADRPGNCTF